MLNILVYKSDDNKTKCYTFSFEDKERCDYAFNTLQSELQNLIVHADDNSFTLNLSEFEDDLIEEAMKHILIVEK